MTFDKIKDFVLDTFFEEIEYDENEEEVLVDEDDEEDVWRMRKFSFFFLHFVL